RKRKRSLDHSDDTQKPTKQKPTISRLDFWLRSPAGDHYIEAKNCHMVYPDGNGYFPDSISTRASRHVGELEALVKDGTKCTVIFVVQREDLQGSVRPSEHHDPAFAAACRRAALAGVCFRAVLVSCSLSGLTVQREVNVDLAEYDLRPIAAWVAENRNCTGWIRSASQRRVANGPFPHERQKCGSWSISVSTVLPFL
ncbi:Sugar fermentation stimulation protein homolog, partial [Durusdinium trenchii]